MNESYFDLNYFSISNIKIGYKNYLVKYYLQKLKIDSLNNLKGLSDQSINKLQNAPIFKKYFELSIGSGGSMFTGSVSSPSIFTNEVTVNNTLIGAYHFTDALSAAITISKFSDLKGFLNTKGISSFQMDLGIEVILSLFSKDGLTSLFKAAGQLNQINSENSVRINALQKDYCGWQQWQNDHERGQQNRVKCSRNYLGNPRQLEQPHRRSPHIA